MENIQKIIFNTGTVITPEFLNNLQDFVFGNSRNLKVFEISDQDFSLDGWTDSAIVRYTGVENSVGYRPPKLSGQKEHAVRRVGSPHL